MNLRQPPIDYWVAWPSSGETLHMMTGLDPFSINFLLLVALFHQTYLCFDVYGAQG